MLLGYFGASLLAVAGLGYSWYLSDPAPAQPIAFPHTVHAGTLKLPCTFCHQFVELSRHAGAPPLEVCMSCHRTVATDREEIKKLTAHYEGKKPVEWTRVYEIPDFIYFSHKRHVKAGLACDSCHGDVTAMLRVRRVRNLQMGWCVSCHRMRNAPMDCWTCHK
jgi:hypothetical protein